MPKIDEAQAALKELFAKATDKPTIEGFTKVNLLLEDAKKEEKDLTDASAKLLEDYKKLVVTGVKSEAPHEDGAPVMPKTLDECADEVLNKKGDN